MKHLLLILILLSSSAFAQEVTFTETSEFPKKELLAREVIHFVNTCTTATKIKDVPQTKFKSLKVKFTSPVTLYQKFHIEIKPIINCELHIGRNSDKSMMVEVYIETENNEFYLLGKYNSALGMIKIIENK